MMRLSILAYAIAAITQAEIRSSPMQSYLKIGYAINYFLYVTATGFILQHRFFANFTCLSSLPRHFKPLKNINIGPRH